MRVGDILEVLEDCWPVILMVLAGLFIILWCSVSSANRYFDLCMQQPGVTRSYCEMRKMEYVHKSGASVRGDFVFKASPSGQ